MSKFELKTASRKKAKLKVGFIGPSGSGKTSSGLRFAKGLVGDLSKVAVIDTENNSSALYSHMGPFKHLDFGPPFDPRRYVEAIHFIEKNFPEIEVIIIDSISHEWEGEGGCLQIHESLGGKFPDWAKVTPLHNAFINAILQSRCHVIVCARSKIEYALSKDSSSNKNKVEKLGMKTISREGLDYELTLSFRIDERHFATVDKDRTGMFSSYVPQMITEEIGEKVRDWNMGGEEPEEPQYTIKDLTSAFMSLSPECQAEARETYKTEFEKVKNNGLSSDEIKNLIHNIKQLRGNNQ